MQAVSRRLFSGAALSFLGLLSACATSSTDWTKVEQEKLQEAVKSIADKIKDDKEVPRFKETGDPTIDVLVKPFVDEGTEAAPRALEIAQQLESAPAITVLNRSVEAAMAADPELTEEQATQAIAAKMSAAEKEQLDAWRNRNEDALEAYNKNATDWIAKSIPLLADLAKKVQAAESGGMDALFAGATAAIAINNGIDQVNAVIEFVAPANELVRRANDRMATIRAYNEANLRNR